MLRAVDWGNPIQRGDALKLLPLWDSVKLEAANRRNGGRHENFL